MAMTETYQDKLQLPSRRIQPDRISMVLEGFGKCQPLFHLARRLGKDMVFGSNCSGDRLASSTPRDIRRVSRSIDWQDIDRGRDTFRKL